MVTLLLILLLLLVVVLLTVIHGALVIFVVAAIGGDVYMNSQIKCKTHVVFLLCSQLLVLVSVLTQWSHLDHG